MFLKALTALSLTLVISAPVIAKETINSSSQNLRPLTFTGKTCQSISDNKVLPCARLVVTGFAGESKNLNFHFELKNNAAITYITNAKPAMVNGMQRYEILGFAFLKADGTRSEVFKGSGNCDTTGLPKNPTVVCEVTGEDFKMKSTYNK
jgi:hypothetical protein